MGSIGDGQAQDGTLPPPDATPSNGGAPEPSTNDAGAEPDPQVLTGQELYAAYCGACHGANAEGSALGPELQHPKPDFGRWVVRNGYSGAYATPMMPFDAAAPTDEQLDAILVFLGELPRPETGAALYADYCANCHGADANGGPAEKEIAGRSELEEDTRRGKGGSNYGARERYMPGWNASELSDAELQLLQDYVGGLRER